MHPGFGLKTKPVGWFILSFHASLSRTAGADLILRFGAPRAPDFGSPAPFDGASLQVATATSCSGASGLKSLFAGLYPPGAEAGLGLRFRARGVRAAWRVRCGAWGARPGLVWGPALGTVGTAFAPIKMERDGGVLEDHFSPARLPLRGFL